jgi:hypothetical protein
VNERASERASERSIDRSRERVGTLTELLQDDPGDLPGGGREGGRVCEGRTGSPVNLLSLFGVSKDHHSRVCSEVLSTTCSAAESSAFRSPSAVSAPESAFSLFGVQERGGGCSGVSPRSMLAAG